MGVLRGFAGIKFSGSFNKKGSIKTIVIKKSKTKIIARKSLIAKNFINGILSKFNQTPRGFLEPFSCKKKICKITTATKIIGNKK